MERSLHVRRWSRGWRALLLAGTAISLVLVSGPTLAADFDPSRPTSSKGAGQAPPLDGPPTDGDEGGLTHKVALGITVPDGRDMAKLDANTVAVGVAPAIWSVRVAWGDRNRPGFPGATLNELKSRGVTPLLWWTPNDPANPGSPIYSRHQNIIRGDHDAYIRSFARDAKAFGSKVLLRFAHESNSDFFPWSINNHDNSAESFISMWRHVHQIFEAEGASNVKWVWSVAKKSCSGCNPYTSIWPGKSYVDVMAYTAYNWGTNREWVSMHQTFKRPYELISQLSDLPLMVVETGSSPDGGDKAAWIRTGYREVYEAFPRIMAIVWTDSDQSAVGHPDWRLSTPTAAMAAYAEIAALDKFSARNPFSVRKAKSTRVRRADREARETTAKATRKAPRVQKGSVEGGDAKPASKATKTTNKITKPSKREPAPPEVLDSFSR